VTTTYLLIDGINPIPWQTPDFSIGRAKGGKLYGNAASPPAMKAFQAAIREELNTLAVEPFPKRTPLYVFFYYWRSLDRYNTPTGRSQTGSRADVTNLNKNLEDALQQVPKKPDQRFMYFNDVDNRSVMGLMVEQAVGIDPLIFIAITDNEALVMQLASISFVTPIVTEMSESGQKVMTVE
jgi:hypothetical protein